MIHITINGKPVEAAEGSTIMEAAESVGIKVPSLCHGRHEEPAGILYGKGAGGDGYQDPFA